MKTSSSFPGLIFLVVLAIGAGAAFALHQAGSAFGPLVAMAVAIVCAAFVSSAIRVADPCTKAVVLRLGKFGHLRFRVCSSSFP